MIDLSTWVKITPTQLVPIAKWLPKYGARFVRITVRILKKRQYISSKHHELSPSVTKKTLQKTVIFNNTAVRTYTVLMICLLLMNCGIKISHWVLSVQNRRWKYYITCCRMNVVVMLLEKSKRHLVFAVTRTISWELNFIQPSRSARLCRKLWSVL